MKTVFYFVLFLFFASCGESKKDSVQVIEKSEKSTVKKHTQVLAVNKESLSEIDDWKEYDALNNFIEQYASISPNEALNNSRELNSLTKSLNDSLKPTFLKSDAFNARVNFMYNETLRLYDMSSISAIKTEEVNSQVEKVLHAYSSINSKINTILLQTKLDSEVSDINFNKTIDTTSKVSNIKSVKVTPLKKKKTSTLSKKEEKIKFMKGDRQKKRNMKLKEMSKKKKNEKKN
jgi:hypothetical protein